MANYSATVDSLESPRMSRGKAVRSHIRGSSLLFAGRLLSKGITFGAQVLVVRYFSQAEFGALAYALAIATLCEHVISFGLGRAVTRFVPIYHEREKFDKLWGTIVLALGTVASLAIVLLAVFFAVHAIVGWSLIEDPLALSLLMVLVFLAPVQAIDRLLIGLLAVFASARVIFFRKFVLAPSLKLAAVTLLILFQADVVFLAVGYLIAGTIGMCVCASMLTRVLASRGLLREYRRTRVTIPWRSVFGFTIPVLTTDLVFVVMHSADVIVLRHYGTLDEVAQLRAILPLAVLNHIVLASFTTLYTPLAARLFARHDHKGIDRIYWTTTMWVAVLTFPLFALTFVSARPLTEVLYGVRYQQSAGVLAVLSLGYYFHASLGFNAATLKVCGKLRAIVGINLCAAALNLAAIMLLIPRYGIMGAAWGTCFTMIAHSLMKQAAVRLGTPVSLINRQCVGVYASLGAAACGLWFVHTMVPLPLILSSLLIALVAGVLFRLNRHVMDTRQTFPELQRIPAIAFLLGEKKGRGDHDA